MSFEDTCSTSMSGESEEWWFNVRPKGVSKRRPYFIDELVSESSEPSSTSDATTARWHETFERRVASSQSTLRKSRRLRCGSTHGRAASSQLNRRSLCSSPSETKSRQEGPGRSGVDLMHGRGIHRCPRSECRSVGRHCFACFSRDVRDAETRRKHDPRRRRKRHRKAQDAPLKIVLLICVAIVFETVAHARFVHMYSRDQVRRVRRPCHQPEPSTGNATQAPRKGKEKHRKTRSRAALTAQRQAPRLSLAQGLYTAAFFLRHIHAGLTSVLRVSSFSSSSSRVKHVSLVCCGPRHVCVDSFSVSFSCLLVLVSRFVPWRLTHAVRRGIGDSGRGDS